MPMLRSRRAAACAVATAVSLALGGPALASAATAETTMSVSPRVEIVAPATSPVDFPGVSNVREGERLPRGWIVVSRDVKITRGDEPAFAGLRMTCPAGKTWRSGTSSDDINASLLDRNARSGKRSVLVMAGFSTSDVRVGETAAGTVFALCR